MTANIGLLQLDLFAEARPAALAAVVAALVPKRKRPLPGGGGWELADHACRHCLGRVLQRRVRGVTVEVRCAECGAAASGGHAEVCCCGAECGTLGHVLECFRNQEVSQSVPQEVLVRERPVDVVTEVRRRPKLVGNASWG